MNRSPRNPSKKRTKSARDDHRSGESRDVDAGKGGKPKGSTKKKQDPAESRAETFRVAAQRETVEAFVVAFILALLFRAFLAEAFVIPTGSMAPTLMGAHKDIVCSRCDRSFRTGASLERKEPITRNVVVGAICPNCRFTNPLDLADDPNHATFNGDRILVSKFSYTLKEPKRWDVIVFKYPGNPKQNYIKRLVGLPNEVVTIRHGDVYARPAASEASSNQILRKPEAKLLSMRHLVYDTAYQSPELIEAGYPSRWQPWTEKASEPPSDSWKVERNADGWTAAVTANDDARFHWLRYYHRWPSQQQWQQADNGQSLADVDPYSSRLITDFYAYNSYINVYADRVFKYDQEPATFRGSRLERMLNGGYSRGDFRPEYNSGGSLDQFGQATGLGNQDMAKVGLHWVGDLIVEADVESSEQAKEVLLELVEAGVKYRCRIDLATGKAQLGIDDVEDRFFDDPQQAAGVATRVADTSVRAGQRHQLRLSNCDEQLLLWVDGDLIAFDGPTTFDASRFRSDQENHPVYLPAHPLDAAPVGIAVRGGSSTVHHLRVDRDKYYIATSVSSHLGLDDYDDDMLWELARRSVSRQEIQEVFSRPDQWAVFQGWQTRRSVSFRLEEDQFFPMGDNSPESLDARCWAGTKNRLRLPGDVNELAYQWTNASYVPRDLLVGKALVVFWPHSWQSPVPFTPNFRRMKLIR